VNLRRDLYWIYCILYVHTLRGCMKYSAIAILHTFQLTVTHALGLSVFTSRTLATDLSQSRCHIYSHIKSSWHNLIPFLPFLFNHLRLIFRTKSTSPFWSKSKLLYDWRFAANQFVLASSSMRLTIRIFLQLNSCGNSPYVTSSLMKRWGCLL
jgi:hypothetical protein